MSTGISVLVPKPACCWGGRRESHWREGRVWEGIVWPVGLSWGGEGMKQQSGRCPRHHKTLFHVIKRFSVTNCTLNLGHKKAPEGSVRLPCFEELTPQHPAA